jgi:L-seryl-tRNA(Ser) seleniumtransferase
MPLTPRHIPSIDALRQDPDALELECRYGPEAVTSALRDAAAEARNQLASDPDALQAAGVETPEALAHALIELAARQLAATLTPSLTPVINATGVLVHTNLGRAPLAAAAIEHLGRVARGYTNLEFDLAAGRRGRRDVHAEALLQRLTGAEAAVVVNNNAAATLLILAALAEGREVVISRGELVEIGGGFRVPDVMRQSGAILREVGTTNRTRVADYAAALTDRTAMILRVHPSNFRLEGFTERPDAAGLVALGRQFGLPVVEDLGSGNVLGPALGLEGEARAAASPAVRDEPSVHDSLRAGYDLVCVSGDKLLGGPQAGLVLGRRDLVSAVRRHPLMRALRVDKLTYAALEATAIEHLAGRAARTVPVVSMIHTGVSEIASRARRVAQHVGARPTVRLHFADGESTIGGGSAPGSRLPTCLLVLEVDGIGADDLAARLRRGAPPVVARIEHDRVVLDLRTVLPEEDQALAAVLAAALP